jgi:hypothetical protein
VDEEGLLKRRPNGTSLPGDEQLKNLEPEPKFFHGPRQLCAEA